MTRFDQFVVWIRKSNKTDSARFKKLFGEDGITGTNQRLPGG
jgi:hypothetical protein